METPEARDVALFCKDIYEHLRKRHQRRPSALQTLVACYAAAVAIVDTEARYLGGPSRIIRSSIQLAVQEISAPSIKFCEKLTRTAIAVIKFFDEAGDLKTAKNAESIALDRRLLSLAAQLQRADKFSERAIARVIGLHRRSVGDRLTSRAARTLSALNEIAPSIWSNKGRPVEGPADASGKVWSDKPAVRTADDAADSAMALAA